MLLLNDMHARFLFKAGLQSNRCGASNLIARAELRMLMKP